MIKLEATNDKPFKTIWVKWVDSTTYSARWYSLREAANYIEEANIICESVGYLLYEDKEKLVICDSIAHGDDDNKKIRNIHGIYIIPIASIIDWRFMP